MNWRHLNTVLHRDIGYLAVGLTVVYGVSGVAVNHKADWNPSYAVEKTARRIDPIAATERAEIIREALRKLSLSEQPRNAFRPNPETLQLFFRQQIYSIDLPTGNVIVEQSRSRPVLFEMNQMHLNTPKRIWTFIADLYAIALVVLAITGMFVLKGKLGITGRGAWLTSMGVMLPVVYWAYYLYFG
ncbi:MAG: PepSY-associated TM helix domain-containing protein [Acidobacteriota bacterium]